MYHQMTDTESSPMMFSSLGSSSSEAIIHDEDIDNACSICLENFNTTDPKTVTNCKHEYHLQCILEWSQRRKECPICWQILVLKDPASQELLAAVENERNLRSKRIAHHVQSDHDVSHDDTPYEDGSDFETRIMRHFAAAARRARFVSRRGRDISPNIGYSQVLFSVPQSDIHQIHMSPEHQRSSEESSDGDSSVVGSLSTTRAQYAASSVPEVLNVEPLSVGNCTKASQHLPESPQRPSSSESSAFSDSFKSKFSAASSRYKESISKGTRGFKEKLLARNISVKELGKGVQREMNAGIAGVTRIIERLDLASKKNGVSAHLSNCTKGTSNISSESNNDMQGTVSAQHEGESFGEHAHVVDSAASSRVQSTISSKFGSSAC